jgi:CHAD domain-containing protein
MRVNLQKVRNIVLFLIAGALFAPTLTVRGEDHLVSPTELHDTLTKSAETRQKNLEKVQRFFSSERVRKTLDSTKIDLKKVENTVHQLNDKELARLAAQAEKVQADVAAGALDNQEITYIIIALATAVLILVIVVA